MKTDLQKPEAVIFDWDGTLVNTLPGIRIAHNHVRVSLGFDPWTEDEFRANLKHSSRELYPRLYGDMAEKAYQTLYEFIAETHIEHLEVLPGAFDLLKFLNTRKFPCGLVSNKNHDYLVKEVSHLGWSQYFFCILGSGQALKDKPAADPIILALELAQLPLSPEKIWFVGDTETDLLAAKAAGSPAVLITHGADRSDLIGQYQPILVARDCMHLREELERLSMKSLAEPHRIE